MNSTKILSTLLLSIMFLQTIGQSELPKGYKKGMIVLGDNSSISGYIKENMRGNATVVFISDAEKKKKSYTGSDLISAEIDGIKYLCIHGDFFKIICEGELDFLQKSSDASGKPSFNGNEAVFSNGTEGKPDDYFIYNSRSRELKLISKKNCEKIINETFTENTAAMDKARAANGDIAQLKDAIVIYNKSMNK